MKKIPTAGNQDKAADARLKKATDTWEAANRNIPTNQAIEPKIKILLWNSLIRRTAIYGLHTGGIQGNLPDNMDAFMHKHLRMMTKPRWKQGEWYPGKSILYRTQQQSAME